MINWKKALPLISILVIALTSRLYKINNPVADWHSWRQADTASVSRNYLKNGIDLLHPVFDDISDIPSGKENPNGYRFVEFPIPNAIHAQVASFLPSTNFELLGRILSVIYSLVSVVALYLLVKLHLDEKTAIMSAFIFSVLPFGIYYSRVILPEPLLITVSLSFLLFFSQWVQKPTSINTVLSFLSFSLLLLLKAYMFVFAIPAFVYYLTTRKPKRNEIFKILIFWSLSIIPFLLWFFWARRFPEGIPHFKWAFNGDGIRFKPSFFYWIFGIRFGELIMGIWGVYLFIHGLINSFETKKYFFVSWVLAILVYVSTIATANVRHDYYQAISVPMFASVMAIGFVSVSKKSIFHTGIATFCLSMAVLMGINNIKGYYQINHPEIIEAGNAADHLLPKDAIVIAPYNGDTAFLYHINRKGWPHVTLPIEELIEKGATHYVSVNFDSQTDYYMSRFKVLTKSDRYLILDLKSAKGI